MCPSPVPSATVKFCTLNSISTSTAYTSLPSTGLVIEIPGVGSPIVNVPIGKGWSQVAFVVPFSSPSTPEKVQSATLKVAEGVEPFTRYAQPSL